jgi:hypothetical protein
LLVKKWRWWRSTQAALRGRTRARLNRRGRRARRSDDDEGLKHKEIDEQQHNTRERKERKREKSFTDDDFYRRRWRRSSMAMAAQWIRCSGVGKNVCGSERKGTRETPGFYMDREREREAKGGGGRRPFH